MFERFTERARKVIIYAREEAARLQHDFLGTEHILLGLVREGGGVGVAVLQRCGVRLDDVRREVYKRIVPGNNSITFGDIPLTPRAKKILELAVEEANMMGHNYVGTEHILLGLVKEQDGLAANILGDMRIDLSEVRHEMTDILQQTSAETKQSNTPTLDEFGRDLTLMAANGELDPVIGRDDEIERVIQILTRRTKNNPVLIGEAGVGKTAVVEGLAQRIVKKSVPNILYNKRLVSLDLGQLVAGTKYRGQFEERLKTVMREILESDTIILFIDELHTLVGAGAAEGSMDASNLLKPALSRGELQCIGATTMNEYRKHIEKDGALERRFQTILVREPSERETVEIVKGLRDKYEEHHGVSITGKAIEVAARLSTRYISDRFQPDKAIDVIDEACSRARLKKSKLPDYLKSLEDEINTITKEKNAAVSAQDFEIAACLRDRERRLLAKFDSLTSSWRKQQDKKSILINGDDVAYIVSKWTGVPLYRLEKEDYERLAKMSEKLHKRVVGQDEAIAAVSRAIRRSRVGLKHPNKPVGSFLFLGPTGVGKTELAHVLAEFLFSSDKAIIRFDMSEYTEKFSISRLTGSPPGYVGHEEGGQLTEKVRRKPYSVILLDEIEKAHPDVFNILLQVLEDGRLTDGLGRTVDFKNCVLIMTSNIGGRMIEKDFSLGFQKSSAESSYEKMKQIILEELKNTFSPEFISRLDETIVFHALTKEHISKIVGLQIQRLNERIKECDLKLVLTDQACSWLVDKAYRPGHGARLLRKIIQQNIEDALADKVLQGKFKKKGTIQVGVIDNKLIFTEREFSAESNLAPPIPEKGKVGS
jgi:ATP-dependent Clp protease ATP-binding subunit ClpC